MKFVFKFSALIAAVLVLMLIGTLSYHELEGWNYIDSVYFTAVTLTTIRYGDLHPTTEAAKLFTVFFVFAGVSVVLFAFTLIGQHFIERSQKSMVNVLSKTSGLAENYKEKIKKRRDEIIQGSSHE